ncbi:MAG: carotenoid oxygenase family protein [Actinomycetota bacterium]|nr:carotenoid oxygenase family protein [Actinomycetota bacterium]
MATLTTNLFRGQGPASQRLEVIDGHWPDDVDGSVFIVGPDKRRPGGHWFGEPGLLARITMRPDPAGRIAVRHRVIDTPVVRLRRRLPFLFGRVAFMELSPFGVTNYANTNVDTIDGRLFVGYDAGRPVEVDPATMRYVTAVGGNDEWLQAVPGLLEPLCAVAAHPAVDVDDGCMYFLNYTQLAPPGVAAEAHLASWDLEGPVRRWRLTGMSPYDSIHDVKVSRDHVVFADLPFVVEPETFRGAPRSRRNQQHTTLWIVAKDDLRRTAPGGEVPVTEVRLPMPTGHLSVDVDEVDGLLRVVAQHMPLADLMVTATAGSTVHGSGDRVHPDHEGLIALAVQPTVVGRYLIDPVRGEIVESDSIADPERVWGGVLATSDRHRPEARRRQRQLWFAGMGFDPQLVTEEWWRLYGTAEDGVVAPGELPDRALPGTLSRFDLESMKVAEVWEYPDGEFPSPPTFVPRVGSDDADDGYVLVVVHRDGTKELQLFDAAHLDAGPIARASTPGFSPALALHSCHVPDPRGRRRSGYRIPLRRDVAGALRALPGVLRTMIGVGRAMTEQVHRD